MSDRRFRFDLSAQTLFVCWLLVTLCVLSQNLAPPYGKCLGSPGAWLALSLYESLGSAVYFLLAGWFLLVVLLCLRRTLLRWFLRLAGFLLLLPCSAVVAHYLGWRLPNSPPTGAGGSIGAWIAEWLQTSFYAAGRISIFGSCSLLGLMLAADFAVIYLLGRSWKLGRWSLIRLRSAVATLAAGARWLLRQTRRKKADRPARREVSVDRGVLQAPHIPVEHLSDLPADPDRDVVKVPNLPQPAKKEERAIPIHHHDQTAASLATNLVNGVAALARAVTTGSLSAPAPGGQPAPEGEKFANFELPPLTLLEDPQPFPYADHDNLLRERAALLEKTFINFGLSVQVVKINTGPVITQYEIALETGLRLHKVTSLADDLAINLKVPSVPIVAPIPGKNTVGIEIPNEHRAVVRLKEVILTSAQKIAKSKVPLFLGKDTEGHPLVYDLAEMPHLLIAGRTGTGKSVCMNAIILSILMTRRPDEVKMIMIDPKMLELSEYGKIPHLMHPVVKDMKKAEAILSWAVDKMEERYDLLSRARVRGIAGYNELSHEEILRRVQPGDDEARSRIPERMPYIIIFVDEMNDLMMTMRKEVEGHIIRLAQKSRAAGIHLVVATQKPTVDVITGLIKSNLPARICFQVSSRVDSRVVLDEMGADKLLGKGDMLFLQPGTSTLMRAQGTYASDEEIRKVVENLNCEPCFATELVQLKTTSKEGQGSLMDTLRARDDMYEPAIEIVIREGRGSVSLLQRLLGIGYGRAARLIDFMAEDGIVGTYNGSSAREVLYNPEQWEIFKQGGKPVESKTPAAAYSPSAN